MSRLIDADELIKRLNEKALAQHNIPLVEHDFRELIEEAAEGEKMTCPFSMASGHMPAECIGETCMWYGRCITFQLWREVD